MKLSIEEKAKAYDEAKARIKAAWDSNRCTLGFMNEIFPELKESKDEKIRRIVYGWINTQPSGFFNLNDISKKDMLDWLEKQGTFYTKKDVDDANKVEPKLNIGDWVVRKDGNTFTDGRTVSRITKIYKEQYWVDCGVWFEAKNIRLWAIEDAKDGDILALNDEVFIYSYKRHRYNIIRAHCFVDSVSKFYIEGDFLYTEKENSIHPATIEQMQKLFSAMHDAGYIWNVKNKVIIKDEE